MRWDSFEERLPTLRKKEPTHESQKSLHLILVRDNDKLCDDENSMVGSQKGKMIEVLKVTSPIKPKLDASADEELGFLDIGQNKEKTPTKLRK